MMKPQFHHHHSNSTRPLPTRPHSALLAGDGKTCSGDSGSAAAFLSLNKLSLPIKCNGFHAAQPSRQIKAIATDKSIATTTTKVKAIITVQVTMGGLISSIGLTKGLDDITDLLGKSLLLELVAAEVDDRTGLAKDTIQHYAHHTGIDIKDVKYVAEFEVPEDFGQIGAILIENEHHKEMYLEKIELEGFSNNTITINPNSWVHSKFENPEKRVFFTNKVVCLLVVIPSLQTSMIDQELPFPHFTSIDCLYWDGLHMPQLESKGFLRTALPRLFKTIEDTQNNILRFEIPAIINSDKFTWIKDEEFCRQTLAGLHPCAIQAVKEWPLKSQLDPEVYGPPESAITTELVEEVIGGIIPVEEVQLRIN
ncbi:hypothetical protein L2E82_05100 [Cichorium intybus]|uniref:Uncharacterized protein n=1 Tax=Cichorium intybus TaxID=13427 RepID=A0ACB9H7V7_CICIN|nr:hypothetical protein L2E82_05100 [Cichorium intybus]